MQFVNKEGVKPNTIEQREYQILLADRVLEKGNSLIVAPTALGKTVVAALVSASRVPKGKILFLAPTKPLAVQHLKSMRQFLDLPEDKFTLSTGAVPPINRKQLWGNAQIICGTPQALENDILTNSISLDDVSLLIIDECHRAVSGYSYVYITEQYHKNARNELILALTASPGSTHEKIQEICNNLFIKNVEVKTDKDADVKPFIQKKEVYWKKVKLTPELSEIQSLFKRYMQEQMKEMKDLGLIDHYSTASLNKRHILGLQATFLKQEKTSAVFQGLSIVAGLMKMNHALELLESQGLQSLKKFFEKLNVDSSKAAKRIISDLKIKKALIKMEKIEGEHPKVDKLVEIVKQELEKTDNIIVFSHYRDTSMFLKKELDKHGISSERFMGQATKGNDKGLTQKKQIEMLEQFRNKEFNVLIATSVAEEGLDIPSVDCIIFYEPVSSEIRLIQRRGRTGRKHAGKVIILMTEGTRDEAYYWVSRSKEKRMYNVLNQVTTVIDNKKQKTLGEFKFEPSKTDEIIVYVDNRERASGITRELQRKEVAIKPTQLLVGDFLLSDRLVIERKSANDFIDSLISGRLFKQAAHLKENFAKPIIIIEGNVFGIRNIHDNALRGAIASLIIDFNIPIIQTRDVNETAEMVKFLAKREQIDLRRDVKLRGTKRSMPVKEQQQFIVESLPLVGPTLAKNLLTHFKSVKNVFTAPEKELKEVENLGDKKAKEIKKIIDKDYE